MSGKKKRTPKASQATEKASRKPAGPTRPDEAFDAAWDDAAEGLSEEQPASDRRQFDRVAVGAQISMSSETNLYVGLTSDLSEGGVFVSTYQTLPMGTAVDLDLSFEEMGGPRIAAKAEVRWIRDESAGSDAVPGMGVRFVDLPESDRQWIADFVKQREPIFHEEAEARSSSSPVTAVAGEGASDRDLLGERSPMLGVAVIAGAVVLVLGLGYLLFFSGGDGDSARRAGKVTPAAEGEVQATPASVTADQSGASDSGVAGGKVVADGAPGQQAPSSATPDAATPDAATPDAVTPDAVTPDAAHAKVTPDAAAALAPAPAKTPSVPASTGSGQPSATRAGAQIAAAIRPCVGAADEGAMVKLALYVQASGKVVRGFVAGRRGLKLTGAEVKCVRAKVRGAQLPLTLKKTGYVEWSINFGPTATQAVLIKPAYLRD